MYYVYIMSNSHNTTLYDGVTNDLIRRVYEHKNHLVEGFTNKYNTNKYNIEKLVYFESISDVTSAIEREKIIKKFRREKKEILINSKNPLWNDLYDSLL